MSDKRIEVDIAAAVALLQESPELCEVMNKLVGVPALDAALAEIELLRAERDAMREALEKWRAAREAFLALPPIGPEPENRVPSDIWQALATGEQDLYQLANRAALAPSPAGPVCDVCNGTGQVSEWRPIETAPKDGTRFLAYWPHFGVSLVHRHDPGGIARNPQHHYECWVRDDNMPLGGEPSHWMPLPPSPAGREG